MSGETALRTLSHIALAAQFSLGIVFLLSAVPKLRRPRLFAWGVVAYDILPGKVSYVFALALIPLELFLAITFLTGWLMSIALALATLLLVVFTVAVGINLRRGRLVDCGCFGAGSEPISTRSVARLFLLLTVVLLLAALRATGSAVPLTLDLASLTNPVTFAYLLQAAMLATFLILLGVWMLRLPELVLFVRREDSGDKKERADDARCSTPVLSFLCRTVGPGDLPQPALAGRCTDDPPVTAISWEHRVTNSQQERTLEYR